MATGLGMTPEEWESLKGRVDDSFWVMRIIGPLCPRQSFSIRVLMHTRLSAFA